MNTRTLAFALALALLSGCGSVGVETASEKGFRLRHYSSFNFKKPSREIDAGAYSPENQQRVRVAVAEQMEQNGLRRAENPELWVGFFLRVRPKEFSLGQPTAEGASMADIMSSHYGFVYGSGESLNQQQAIKYHEGTLVMDLVDSRSNQIVWQGVTKGAIHPNQTADTIDLRIREAVRKLFEEVPR